ncbi:unnamed protein product, partial [Didymodactylos carnosus]
AFKLLQIHDEFNILNDDVKRVIDLCAAPGSWSQVLSRTLYKTKRSTTTTINDLSLEMNENLNLDEDNVKIIAVDLQTMAPLAGVEQIKGDITKRSTIETILDLLKSSNGETLKADLIICDGAPDVTGLHDIDEFIQGNLVLAALNICLHCLCSNGSFISKIFRTKNIDLLYQQLKLFFRDVTIAKPRSSRNSSVEAFIIGRQFQIPDNFLVPSMAEPFAYSFEKNLVNNSFSLYSACIIPFVACGSLDGFDSDKTYPLNLEGETKQYEYHEPVAPPINPPYEEACTLKKKQQLTKKLSTT